MERKRRSEGGGSCWRSVRGRKKRKKEKKGKKEKGKRKRKKKKRREREPDQRRAVVRPGQARNGTVLQEVGVFLPRFYSTPRGHVMAYRFRQDSERICMMCVIVGRSGTEYMSSRDHQGRARCPRTEQIWAEWKMGVCPNFRTTLANRQRQLQTAITFLSELRFARSWIVRKDL